MPAAAMARTRLSISSWCDQIQEAVKNIQQLFGIGRLDEVQIHPCLD